MVAHVFQKSAFLAALAVVGLTLGAAHAQTAVKPNLLFIMGDDIGWMQPRIYHRGLMGVLDKLMSPPQGVN